MERRREELHGRMAAATRKTPPPPAPPAAEPLSPVPAEIGYKATEEEKDDPSVQLEEEDILSHHASVSDACAHNVEHLYHGEHLGQSEGCDSDNESKSESNNTCDSDHEDNHQTEPSFRYDFIGPYENYTTTKYMMLYTRYEFSYSEGFKYAKKDKHIIFNRTGHKPIMLKQLASSASAYLTKGSKGAYYFRYGDARYIVEEAYAEDAMILMTGLYKEPKWMEEPLQCPCKNIRNPTHCQQCPISFHNIIEFQYNLMNMVMNKNKPCNGTKTKTVDALTTYCEHSHVITAKIVFMM